MPDSPPPFAHKAPLLSYADLPTRFGIMYERTPDGLYMSIPIPIWKRFLAFTGMVPLLLLLFMGGWGPLIALVVVIVVLILRKRLAKPLIIDLTADELVLRNVLSQQREEIRMKCRYRRSDVYDVKYVSHSGNIVIHAHHHELLELRPINDARVLEWIARTLREALWPSQAQMSDQTIAS
jgi:hypothetical protein